MRNLQMIFALLAIYGLVTSQVGGALLAVFMFWFIAHAARHYRQQDQQWLQDARHARTVPTTEELLIRHQQEATRSNF